MLTINKQTTNIITAITSLLVIISLTLLHGQVRSADLPQAFTAEQLAVYDGTDPQKPIYLGLDGLVYDVTPGAKYYKPGGSYHSLAGRDASKQLHLAGGAIIKSKYPVIGILK